MKCLYSLISIFLLSYYVTAKSLPMGSVKDIQVDMKDPCSNEVLSVLRYLLPYPSDETKYIECNPWGFYTIRQCGVGMKWNSWLMSCVRTTMEPPVDKNVGLVGVTEATESMNSTLCSYFGKDKCLNGGICNVYLDGSSRCLCTTNWTGVFCEIASKVPMGGLFGDMVNETFSLDLYKQQRPLLNTSIEFNMTDPELLKDPETKVRVEKYMALYQSSKLTYHELVNYLVDDFLSLLYPSPFYLQEFNFPSELQTGLSGAIPNLLMTSRYVYAKFDDLMRVYEDVLDNIVVYLESKDTTIKTQAKLFYDVYVQIFKIMETQEPVVDGSKVEDLTREETVKRIGETFNMTLEKAYELFKVANRFDDDLAVKGENYTTEQMQYAIGNFSISPEVVQLVTDIQEINADLYDSLSFYGFWYVLSSYLGPMESDVVGTTIAPIVGSKMSVRSSDGEDSESTDDAMDIRGVEDYFTDEQDQKRELLLATTVVPIVETTRVPKSLLEETTRVIKSLLEETTRIPKSLVEETTRVPKSLVEETTRVIKSLLEETTRLSRSLVEETTRIPKSLVEETTRVPKSIVDETTRVPKSVVDETTRVPKSLIEETTRVIKSLLEETTRIPKSLVEETTRIPKSLVEETTRIPKSLVEETTRVPKSLVEETTRIPKSLVEETTRVPKSIVDETTRVPKSIVDETTRVPKSLIEETTRVIKSLLEETTRIPKSLSEETTRIPKSLLEETTRVVKSLFEETTPRVPKSVDEVITTTIDPIQVQLNDLLKSPLNNI